MVFLSFINIIYDLDKLFYIKIQVDNYQYCLKLKKTKQFNNF